MPVNDFELTDKELVKIKRQRKAARKLAKAVRAKGIVVTKRVNPEACQQSCCQSSTQDFDAVPLSDRPELLKKINQDHRTAEEEIEARNLALGSGDPAPEWSVSPSVVFEVEARVGVPIANHWLGAQSTGRTEKGTFSTPNDYHLKHLSDEEKAELTKTQVAETQALESRIKLFNTVNELGLETLEPILKQVGVTVPTWDEIYYEDAKLFL